MVNHGSSLIIGSLTVESSAGVLMSSLGSNTSAAAGSITPGVLSPVEATELKAALGVGSCSPVHNIPQQQSTSKGATLPRGRSATSTVALPNVAATALIPQASSQTKANPLASSTSSLFR
jgi:hypothetical protein